MLAGKVKCPEVDDDEDDQAETLDQVCTADQGKQVDHQESCNGGQFNGCPPAGVRLNG